ncbi:hypothetical protein H1D32_17955 [Anaerobacillus sp. CMMVII]|uniref:hypothetical protein n=1 Tax=Anaerobacillus sp. CMMVII TaxID=2755588 RepID=UPI0021B794EC|nr:hypothetical protein [Anaerobacillus sp. CMMVII]MCT8139420.1 hypothetical protein [Anaerobacillus sp. CMMVII]
MWLYNTWIYQNVINTEWMIWLIIVIVFGFNFLSPIFFYYALAEKKMKFNLTKYMKKFANSDQSTGS